MGGMGRADLGAKREGMVVGGDGLVVTPQGSQRVGAVDVQAKGARPARERRVAGLQRLLEAPRLPQRGAKLELGRAGLEPRGLAGLHRLLEAAELGQHHAAPMHRFGPARLDRDRPVEGRQRVLRTAKHAQRRAPVHVRGGILGGQCDDLVEQGEAALRRAGAQGLDAAHEEAVQIDRFAHSHRATTGLSLACPRGVIRFRSECMASLVLPRTLAQSS